MAALPYIAEDTIIVLDKSEEMVRYMQLYVNALRHTSNLQGWRVYTGLDVSLADGFNLAVMRRLNVQEQE